MKKLLTSIISLILSFVMLLTMVGCGGNGDNGDGSLPTDAEGNTIYVYEGDEVRKCVFDKQKKCDYCGKCFSAFNKSATE